jgi:hypothetical protein
MVMGHKNDEADVLSEELKANALKRSYTGTKQMFLRSLSLFGIPISQKSQGIDA